MLQWSILSFSKIVAFSILFFIIFLFPVVFYTVGMDLSCIMEWELLSIQGLSLVFSIIFDKVSLMFSFVVSVISFSVMLFTVDYMSGDYNLEYFVMVVMMFVFSMNMLIFFPHMVMLLLGWDGLGLTSYLLVIYYMSDKSLAAGMLTAMTNRIGDALLILGCSWCYISGHWNLSFSSYGVLSVVVLMTLIGSLTKSAQLPFSAWLPAAMAAPTPVSALVHSSTLVTAGIYLMIRFYPSLSLFIYFNFLCFYIGVFTCLMASLSALVESDLKKVIALSTLSQLGVMMMSLGLGQPLLSFFHLVTHALFKALLFLCAGTIIHNNMDNQDVRLMGAISYNMPVTSVAFNSANLSLCGFPFMAGFYSKDMIVETYLMTNMPFSTGVVMLLSVCLTSAYTIKLALYTLWSPFKGSSLCMCTDSVSLIHLSYFILLVGAIGSGAFFSWFMFPSLGVAFLPLGMKLVTLCLIFFFFMVMYSFINNGTVLSGCSFTGSMWFLSFISSSPFVFFSFRFGSVLLYNEYTWMEMLSGKGAKFGNLLLVRNLQKVSLFGSSMMFSYFTTLIVVFILSY